MARPAGISGLAVAAIALGGFLVFAAIRDVELIPGLREILQGKIPAGKPPTKRANFGATSGGASGGPTGSPAAPGTCKLGPVLTHVATLANEIGGMFKLKTIGGWRATDPFPDHPSGRAVDLMINNIPNGKATGQAIADYLVANDKKYRVDYIIWNERSWNSRRRTWQIYGGTNPHTDHVHVTCFA